MNVPVAVEVVTHFLVRRVIGSTMWWCLQPLQIGVVLGSGLAVLVARAGTIRVPRPTVLADWPSFRLNVLLRVCERYRSSHAVRQTPDPDLTTQQSLHSARCHSPRCTPVTAPAVCAVSVRQVLP